MWVKRLDTSGERATIASDCAGVARERADTSWDGADIASAATGKASIAAEIASAVVDKASAAVDMAWTVLVRSGMARRSCGCVRKREISRLLSKDCVITPEYHGALRAAENGVMEHEKTPATGSGRRSRGESWLSASV